MSLYVLDFQNIDKTKLMVVGGKGANLGELSKIEGVHVPDGFCISTKAFKRIIDETSLINELLDKLSLLKVKDRDKIGELSIEIRKVIEGIDIPEDIIEEIKSNLSRLGEKSAYAVRSSATAEDLPTVSFAGQQDTYLNIVGMDAILKHVSKCWASLFTERAITYRIKNGFDHRKIYLSVVVQKMVFPQVAGILFTADPVSSNRKVISIDASIGLGEALVSGMVSADNYKVCNGKIIQKKISTKTLGIYAVQDGGTKEQEIEFGMQNSQALTDEQILQLEHIGRKIEEHFLYPQDIEWCLADDTFYIVQSRPITTLYPIPEINDEQNHVYISVGHQQMMTDPMKPLGLSIWQLIASGQMFKGGGRLFVDVAHILASPDSRQVLLNNMEQHDPLMKDALVTIIERCDFITPLLAEQSSKKSNKGMSSEDIQTQVGNDPAIVSELIKSSQLLIETSKQNIQSKSGSDLFDFILEDIQQLKKSLFNPQNMGVIMGVTNASLWINEKMNEWLGEKNVVDILSQSVSNNVTSEMGLALLDLADVIRLYPEIINYLKHDKYDNFMETIINFDGGQETIDAINSYLSKYGMRCSGEIDITRPRWSEKPSTLIPMILNNIKNFESNASYIKFEQGRQEALKKEKELLERLKQLPDGKQKAKETKQVIDIIRNFSGYREHPKYAIVNHLFVYKQAIMKEAERLVQDNVIHKKEDIYYLTFEELRQVVQTNKLDYQIIKKAQDEYKLYEKLTPPRVITSDGEIIVGKYKRKNIPTGAIVGLPVSSGVIEGRARVILNLKDAELGVDDILVTSFTDPSWTPLFVSIKGLVTEVGGLMTHGAVIAREYGLPAVVGVENATKLIKDGQRIRVNGTEGYVEIL
ncbi:phosphoenolpyruvate synthase [Sedimentibacter sp. MB31-C6]|uniref:phosphoenolpyruvate synthase n=1 Tax=Sedimentibacter sp. MB31-C6 TaxID=3109366 RepID=UPI002DDD7077|nr:phosphoenolpyruvate synthase [Sedimentibacter sp. MB36-C1]WSI03208.1 phosphoenolpyruvate synthase [Sedimentibacter sp. MB36-C1]